MIPGWDQAAALIQQALDYQDTHSLIDVYNSLQSGSAQLWCGDHSVIVTELVDYPRKRACRIWLAAGNRAELINKMLPDIETWAAAERCKSIEIVGRRGWARILTEYHQPHTILEKSL